MTSEVTTGPGFYRVTVTMEKVDPVTFEVLSMRKYRSEPLADLKSTNEVCDLTIKARDRAIVSRKQLTKPKSFPSTVPATSKSPNITPDPVV